MGICSDLASRRGVGWGGEGVGETNADLAAGVGGHAGEERLQMLLGISFLKSFGLQIIPMPIHS